MDYVIGILGGFVFVGLWFVGVHVVMAVIEEVLTIFFG